MASLRKALEAWGVEIRDRCEALGLSRTGRRGTALATAQGPIAGDAFVFAAGAWTPLLNRMLGCRPPIQPGKGYSITMRRPNVCPTFPMIFEEHRVAVTPMASGYRIGSTMEFAGYDNRLNRKRLGLLREGASHYLLEPYCEPIEEEWYGWRPMTTDSKPIIGRSPSFDNVWIAAGHNMLGLSMAPATGKLIAELLNGQPTHLDPSPYAMERFR
jgi:D-amino-acid dehydrogenase